MVRHAQAFKNIPHSALSAAKLDSLTPAGEAQSDIAGRRIRSRVRGGPPLVYCGSPNRVRQTAAGVAVECGAAAPSVDPAFAPLDDGLALVPDPFKWRQQRWAEGEDPRPVGGESLQDGLDRARRRVEALSRQHPDRPLVIVTTGDIAAALLGHAGGVPVHRSFERFDVPHGSVNEIVIRGGRWELVAGGER